jgi:hypothetical protein
MDIMSAKLHRWKAYHPTLGVKIYKNKGTAEKYAGPEGYIVDLYKEMAPTVKTIKPRS